MQLNLVRNAAPSATVAPFPGSFSTAAAAGSSSSRQPGAAADPRQQQQGAAAPTDQAHAAPPPGSDPHWVQAAAEEGVVAYKNLLGPGQNMSHVPGADVEAQEINTVADMVNFEMKKKMYKRFSTGFGVFMVGQLCECVGCSARQSPGRNARGMDLCLGVHARDLGAVQQLLLVRSPNSRLTPALTARPVATPLLRLPLPCVCRCDHEPCVCDRHRPGGHHLPAVCDCDGLPGSTAVAVQVRAGGVLSQGHACVSWLFGGVLTSAQGTCRQ